MQLVLVVALSFLSLCSATLTIQYPGGKTSSVNITQTNITLSEEAGKYVVLCDEATFIYVKMWGAGGAGGGDDDDIVSGGAGGFSEGNLNLTAGILYEFWVGEGGFAYTADSRDGGGGGASGIEYNGTAYLVAGGGGGAAGGTNSGGAGGGAFGQTGFHSDDGCGGGSPGTGGSQTSSGTGGQSERLPTTGNGQNGQNRNGGAGGSSGGHGTTALGFGNGGSGGEDPGDNGGGGGGGGYYGGGGGAADCTGGSGGGGSGYVHPDFISFGRSVAGNGITPGGNQDEQRKQAGNPGFGAGHDGNNGLIFIMAGIPPVYDCCVYSSVTTTHSMCTLSSVGCMENCAGYALSSSKVYNCDSCFY